MHGSSQNNPCMYNVEVSMCDMYNVEVSMCDMYNVEVSMCDMYKFQEYMSFIVALIYIWSHIFVWHTDTEIKSIHDVTLILDLDRNLKHDVTYLAY